MSDPSSSTVDRAPRFTAERAVALAAELYGIRASASGLPSERDQNFRLSAESGDTYVLRIANPAESREVLELQNAAMRHLADAWIGDDDLVVPCPQVLESGAGVTIATIDDVEGESCFVRLTTWLPGLPLARFRPHEPALLTDLGRFFGKVDEAFEPFDHPAAHRDFLWDLANAGKVVRGHREQVEQSNGRAILERCLARFDSDVAPRLTELRRGVIHGDGNDHNVLIDGRDPWRPHVSGLIDFGDMVWSCTVFEPAIAAAYALLGKEDPLSAAARVVGGYHETHPLTESEVELLFELICMRLCASVSIAAHQRSLAPDNEYLGVTERGAWTALAKLDSIHPRLARYTLREACGMTPCAHSVTVVRRLDELDEAPAPVVDADLTRAEIPVFDLAVGGGEIGSTDPGDTQSFTRLLFDRIRAAGAEIGIGRYDEPRLCYAADQFDAASDGLPERRTIHLGIDLFQEAGSPVFAPLAGSIHGFHDNDEPLDYGPTILLRHEPDGGPAFYTLYGHLTADSLEGLCVGQPVEKGRRFASIGAPPINGGWPPHLHFQLIVDTLDESGNFPGVAAPSARAVWKNLSPDPSRLLGIPPERLRDDSLDRRTILAARASHLGPSLGLSYREPLEIVRGAGTYLYDAEGRAYLDAVNNVPHVGHCHPRVVEAARRQMTVLNTNTRYLHELLARYTTRLAGLLPHPLEVCFLVCSGSEANELALRLARAHTGRRDVVVLDGGYHGNTQTLIDVSAYKFDGPGGAGAPAHVHSVPLPDGYRGLYRGRGPDTGRRYATHVADAVDEAARRGGGVSAFLCEPLPGCAGQIVLPEQFLEQAYAHVREAGGLCIADEVQVGFGRVGSRLWAFETQDVVPDIVTLGKPIGNGHPLAAVVTTREIADSFAGGMEYFNTFGGNPVSCAVGLAVLDVIRDEGLQEQALRVGEALKTGLVELQTRHPLIGEVRGPGLFLGVELVLDRETRAPATEQASYVVERMRRRGVLLSADGPQANVLKIKPPLVFGEREADRLVEVLDEVLSDTTLRESPTEEDEQR